MVVMDEEGDSIENMDRIEQKELLILLIIVVISIVIIINILIMNVLITLRKKMRT